MRSCPVCETSLEGRRPNVKTCSDRCKDTAKKRAKRADPQKAARELKSKRIDYHAKTAIQKFGFSAVPNRYIGELIPANKRDRTSVDDVIDYDDDPSTWVLSPLILPFPAGPAEISF